MTISHKKGKTCFCSFLGFYFFALFLSEILGIPGRFLDWAINPKLTEHVIPNIARAGCTFSLLASHVGINI
jgi:hypothetical protein